MKVKGVSIGMQFISNQHRKSKRVSTVVDFIERRSYKTGKIIDYEIVAQHEFMGQTMTTYPAAATVLMNKIK